MDSDLDKEKDNKSAEIIDFEEFKKKKESEKKYKEYMAQLERAKKDCTW